MQVELLTNGGFDGTDCCIGKVFTATYSTSGFRISTVQLGLAGFVDDGSHMKSLMFFDHEVRVLDE